MRSLTASRPLAGRRAGVAVEELGERAGAAVDVVEPRLVAAGHHLEACTRDGGHDVPGGGRSLVTLVMGAPDDEYGTGDLRQLLRGECIALAPLRRAMELLVEVGGDGAREARLPRRSSPFASDSER